MKPPEKIEIAQSDVDILKIMIKYYEEKGGGYSQKETLKLAIKALKTYDDWEKYTAKLRVNLDMAEEKAKEQYQEKWDILNNLPSETELHEIWYKITGIEISLIINKGLKSISKRIRGEK